MSSAAMPVACGDRLGREGRGRRHDLVEAGDEVGARAEVDEPLAGDHLHHRHQEVGVGAGADRHPLGGRLGGAGAPRVDHHEPCRRARRGARCGPGQSGAVAREPFDANGLAPSMSRWSVRSTSGTGTFRPAAEHERRRRSPWDAGRRWTPRTRWCSRGPAAAAGCRAGRPGCGRSGCRRRRAQALRPCSSRIGSSRRSISAKASSQLDLDERAVALDERAAQPVRVLVELLERRALGADVALAEHVVAVAADPHDLLAAPAWAAA